MSVPAYSLWDTLVELRRPRPQAFGFTPNATRAHRCELRIARYEAAAASQVVDPALAHDLMDRRFRWESHLESDGADPGGSRHRNDPDRWSWLDLPAFGWGESIIGLVAIGVAFYAIGGLFLLLLMIPLWMLRYRRRRRCRAAINHKLCPDCCYNLDGIPDAIDPEQLNGQHCGPQRCPECASPWPMLPPPARRAHAH